MEVPTEKALPVTDVISQDQAKTGLGKRVKTCSQQTGAELTQEAS